MYADAVLYFAEPGLAFHVGVLQLEVDTLLELPALVIARLARRLHPQRLHTHTVLIYSYRPTTHS